MFSGGSKGNIGKKRVNSSASFCDKCKRLLFASRDLRGTNGVKFYNQKYNYARYGTYYLREIRPLDSTHPGAHEEIQKTRISVFRNNTGIR